MHTSCRAQLDLIWRHLRTATQDVQSVVTLTEHLDRMCSVESAASRSYQYVLDRCEGMREVWEQYACFLREIKHDIPACNRAREIAERCVGAVGSEVDSSANSVQVPGQMWPGPEADVANADVRAARRVDASRRALPVRQRRAARGRRADRCADGVGATWADGAADGAAVRAARALCGTRQRA